MSFLELLFDPTTSGRTKDFIIWSAMVSPPPIVEKKYWVLMKPFSASGAQVSKVASCCGYVPKWLVRRYGVGFVV